MGYFGMFDTLKPMLIGGKDSSVAASFLLGWAVTVGAGLMSYPIDTIRRRMMMTSGAGANVLRGVAGAGVLAGFDKFQAMYIAWRTSQPKKASTTLVDHPPKHLWLVPWRTKRKELV